MGKAKYFLLAIVTLLFIPSAKAEQSSQGWCEPGPQQSVTSDVPSNSMAFCYDVYQWGGYTGPYYNSGTTGSITAGSSTVTLAAGLDFLNGNGVLVIGAGPATTLGTPSGVTAAVQNITGSTTYYYCVADEDFADGRTACSAAGSVSNATAKVGIRSQALTSCARVSGITTCITPANHNLISGGVIEIPRGSTNNSAFEGTFTTTSASGTTFTFNQYGAPDGTSTGGRVRASSNILVRWNYNLSAFVMKHLIYRCTGASCALPKNAGNYALVGVAVGDDSSFLDYGFGTVPTGINNGDAPATAPMSATSQWLPTTITAGAGTKRLTLATNATTSVSGVKVVHDNAPVLNHICAAIGATHRGGTIYIPKQQNTSAYFFPIASTWSVCGELDIDQPVWANGSIVPTNGSRVHGLAGANTGQSPSFYYLGPLALIEGDAYPLIFFKVASSGMELDNLLLQCPATYQPCIVQDEGSDSSAATSIRYKDVHLQQNGGGSAYIARGGFGFFWDRGGWSSSVGSFASPPAALFTGNCGIGMTGSQLPGIVYTDKTYVFGGLFWDACGQTLLGTDGPVHTVFNEMLIEGAYGPAVRYNTGANQFYAVDYFNLGYSDYLGGSASPLIDLTNAQLGGIRLVHPLCATGTEPALETSSNPYYHGIQIEGGTCAYTGTKYSYRLAGNYTVYNNTDLVLEGTAARVYYQMSAPGPVQSAVVSSGGGVPIGTHTYQVTSVDFESGETLVGTATAVTTSTGNQTVTLTMPKTLGTNVAGFNLYRDATLVTANACVSPQFGAGAVYVDTFGFTCGKSQSGFGTAGITSVGNTEVAAPRLRVNSEVFTAAPRAAQSVFFPSALTSTWGGITWTPDKAITVTRMQATAKTAPVTCAPNAVIRLSDGTTNVNLTVAAASNDSGVISQAYASGTPLTVSVQTAAAGCRTSPADLNVMIQYRMQ